MMTPSISCEPDKTIQHSLFEILDLFSQVNSGGSRVSQVNSGGSRVSQVNSTGSRVSQVNSGGSRISQVNKVDPGFLR